MMVGIAAVGIDVTFSYKPTLIMNDTHKDKVNADLAKANVDLAKANVDLAKANAELTKANAELTKANADQAKPQALKEARRDMEPPPPPPPRSQGYDR